MTKKRVLITGAAGFLGSHLADRFIKEGYDKFISKEEAQYGLLAIIVTIVSILFLCCS